MTTKFHRKPISGTYLILHPYAAQCAGRLSL